MKEIEVNTKSETVTKKIIYAQRSEKNLKVLESEKSGKRVDAVLPSIF